MNRTATLWTIALALLILVFAVPVSANYDPGYVDYTPPTPTPPTPVVTTTIVIPEQVCVASEGHPCGHRTGESVGAACGDPTCGKKDDAKFCGGDPNCYFCCCGCDSGCGGYHGPDPEPEACVIDWSKGMPGKPCK